MKPKPCKICGKLFIPECPSNTICKEDHYAKCPICGKEMIWNSTRELEPCSKECRKEKTRRDNIFKYGVEHPMQSSIVQQHHKEAMQAKYGVSSPLQSEEIRKKAIETNLEKFGTEWALGSKEVKDKAAKTMIKKYGAATTLESAVLRKKVEDTCIERYGAANVMQTEQFQKKASNTTFLRYGVYNSQQNREIKNKTVQTRLDNNDGIYWTEEMTEASRRTSLKHFGVDNPSKSPEIQNKIRNRLIELYGPDYGIYLLRNADHNVISNVNKSFAKELERIGLEVEFEITGIDRYKYDLGIRGQNILIEINPTYTHNIVGNHWSDTGLPIDYHLKKTAAARNAGYSCINVFDWDDWSKVIDLVKPKKSIYARKCAIAKIDPKVASEFLNKFHLQGSVKGQILCLGLIHDNDLVQVMTFGKPRYNKNYYTELLRLCSKSGVAVIGGAQKLFKFATEKLDLDEIVSYCDLSKFEGKVYSKMGMKLVSKTDPQEVWSKEDRRITANLLRQRGYDQLFNTNYGKGTSNNDLMIANGWLPVYDCGQAVYEWRR